MGKLKNVLLNADQKLDQIGEQLKDKEITLPVELLGAGIFLLFSIIMFAVMPSQVIVSESDVVNGRVFPRLLLVIIDLRRAFCKDTGDEIEYKISVAPEVCSVV